VATPKRGLPLCGLQSYLAYVERFDVVPQQMSLSPNSPKGIVPDPVTQQYVLKRAHRVGGHRFGDVVPLTQLRGPVQLVPRFGSQADPHLTMENSHECSGEFWLNKYSDKNMFWSLLQ
jgi:hypothetical protein